MNKIKSTLRELSQNAGIQYAVLCIAHWGVATLAVSFGPLVFTLIAALWLKLVWDLSFRRSIEIDEFKALWAAYKEEKRKGLRAPLPPGTTDTILS